MSNKELKLDTVKIVQDKILYNAQLTKKAEMLIIKYPGNFYDLKEAEKAVLTIEKSIDKEKDFSIEDFKDILYSENIDEKVQEIIFNVRGYGNAYQHSIKGKDKTVTEEKNVELKVTKKSKLKKDLIVILISVIAITGVYYGNKFVSEYVREAYEDLKDKDNDIDDEELLPDAEYEGNKNYEEKTSLVHDNTEITGYYYDEAGNELPTIKHNYAKIAEDILKLEDENINTFEFNLYDVFNELNTGDTILALTKMDQIIKELKVLTRDNQNYLLISNELYNKYSFLEMLVSVTDKDYDENMKYINEYKQNGTNVNEECRGNVEFILRNHLDSFAKIDGGRK